MRRAVPITLALALALSVATTARAQGPHPGHEFQFRFGGFFPAGGGTLWDDNEATFTLDESDFNDFSFGFTYVAPIHNRFELGFNLDFYDSTVRSAYRDFTDQDGFQIFHDSRLEMIPATVDFRFLPTGRYVMRGSGKEAGRHVLHPVPYLGAGAGFLFWSYEEVGDFIDFDIVPNEVFFGRFVEDGLTFETHVLAGIELPMSPTWSFMAEGRYSWANDTPDGDFAGLGSLELGGFYAYVGIAVRF